MEISLGVIALVIALHGLTVSIAASRVVNAIRSLKE